ncbi:YfkD-like protein [Mesobacillus persicus]|uniref:YfkD-like protein n=1 Tax=Mesobacillus persicus TaxID=930146 RepID=A0A1H8CM40_9BACI|nr:YfkD famly protein [Mesobacillus persicus]SEM95494.1 YfkD-like protein [Mesobacillus persicus]
MKKNLIILLSMVLLLSCFTSVSAEKAPEKGNKKPEPPKQEEKAKYAIPDSVMNITKENTYPNPTEDLPYLQPSDLTKDLLSTSKVKIENPDLIRLLNETTINSTPFALGYRAIVYLGEWPLNYESTETSPNWEYQKINTNYYDNRGGKSPYQIHYVQEQQKTVKGGLTAKIKNAEDVQKMMMLTAAKKTGLPLSFETIVGAGTKKDQIYNIQPKRLGYLYGYAPAINEKGKVTFGEVYLMLKGNKKLIVVKNVTSQGIGAWIPIQDHVSFGFVASERPR